MGRFYLAAERRPPQDHLARAKRNRVSKVGVSAGELPHRQRAGVIGKGAAQERLKLRQIEFLALANLRGPVLKCAGALRVRNWIFPHRVLSALSSWFPLRPCGGFRTWWISL